MIYLLVMTRILCLPMYDFEIRINMLQIQTKLVHDKHVSEKTAKCLIIHFDLLSITAPCVCTSFCTKQ